uniref:Monophosphate kinase n=1 Tax=Hyphomicrobium chloromethanicum TaxID=51783 RepID=Q9APK3_9HYPH|nr:monophosphate kinase [Hyphomicrobium chloromethanicum]
MDLTYFSNSFQSRLRSMQIPSWESLQGAFADADGQLRRGLVTLPTSEYGSQAFFLADARAGIVIHHPHDKAKAKEAARRALVALGKAAYGGDLFIGSNCPIGWGLGSSTADVVATLRAVADAYGTAFDPTELARLPFFRAASDSIMFDDSAVLFAQRDGVPRSIRRPFAILFACINQHQPIGARR